MRPLPDCSLHFVTPLVPVRLAADRPLIFAKLEYLSPSGSAKERIARFIVEKAWREGHVSPGSTVIEASPAPCSPGGRGRCRG